jgi:hypothetical protein
MLIPYSWELLVLLVGGVLLSFLGGNLKKILELEVPSTPFFFKSISSLESFLTIL